MIGGGAASLVASASRSLMTGSRPSSDPAQAGHELLAKCAVLGLALALLGHHLGRRALHELRPGQLAFDLSDEVVDALDLLPKALPLGRQVDHAGEIDVELGAFDDGERGA